MDLQSLWNDFHKCFNADDLPGIRRLCLDHPEFLGDPKCRADAMLFAALSFPGPRLVALLHELGVSVDICEMENPMRRPLSAATVTEKLYTVWWLVDHGAEVNWEVPGRVPYCVPLAGAIRDDRLDIVRVLVEAGGRLDVCDRTGRTPLSWAIAMGHKDIADYLRSRGGIESEQAFNFAPPRPPNPVLEYMKSLVVDVSEFGWQPIVSDGLGVAVHGARDDDFVGAFTAGLSDSELRAPAEKERFRHAELAIRLPPDWPDDPKDWVEDEHVWVLQWLHGIAEHVADEGEWLHDPNFVLANGEPPEPLSPFTRMTCWLGLVDHDPLMGFTRPDGRDVVFYTLFPIHTSERDYELKEGLRALLEKFAEHGVSPSIDVTRESVV